MGERRKGRNISSLRQTILGVAGHQGRHVISRSEENLSVYTRTKEVSNQKERGQESWGRSSVKEYLPSIHKALGSVSSTT